MLRIAGLRDPSASYLLSDPALEVAEIEPALPTRRWAGGGARALGLEGPLGPADLREVLAGRTPNGSLSMRSNRRLVAHDLIFASPKAASVLFASRDRRQAAEVVAAHQRGVSEALGYLEARALGVQRGSAERRRVLAADGAVAAEFVHGSSRSGDPHLHSHLLLANLGRDSSGRFGAIDARALYAHRRAAGALYRSVLRRELARRLGVTFDRTLSGGTALRGVSRGQLIAVSGRSEEVRRGVLERPAKKVTSRAEAEGLWARRLALAPEIDDEQRFARPQRSIDEHRVAAALHGRPLVSRNLVEALCDGATAGLEARSVGLVLAESGRRLGRGLDEPLLEPDLCVPRPRVLATVGPRPTDAAELASWLERARELDRSRGRGSIDRLR